MSSVSSTLSPPDPARPRAPLPPRAVEGVTAVVAEIQNAPAAEIAKPVLAASGKPVDTDKVSVPALSKDEVEREVRALQAKMDKLNPALAFVVDPDSGRALIQLTDRATKEVILQFPTQAALQISKALDQFQKGQLVNRTV